MTIDVITLEVIRNRLEAIAQEMQNTLVRSAFSVTLKEGGDCSCAIFSPAGESVSQASANVAHITVFIPALEVLLARYPVESMAEGDVFIFNDPYAGGTHIPDLIVVTPVFAEGRVVALGCSLGHMLDMGGRAPGSMASDSTEVFQEGLAIPPVRLYEQGRRNETLAALLERNVRVPTEVFGDLMALVAAGRTCVVRLGELIARYGLATYQAAVPALLDRSEALTRAAIAGFVDGTYEFSDFVDNDGIDVGTPIEIRARVTVSGSSLHFDFTGTGPQVLGPANCGPGAILAPVHYVVRALTGHAIPSNSGCFRPVSITAPQGSILASRRPAPVAFRYHTLKRVVDVLLGALSPALGGTIPAAPHGSDLCATWGMVSDDGTERSVFMDIITGGRGAGPTRDGIDFMSCDLGNSRNIPAEAVEMEYPIRVWRNQLRMDSGGPGRHRGGLGIERELELLSGSAIISARSDRHVTAPWGIHGGKAGSRWVLAVKQRDGLVTIVHGRSTLKLSAGDRLLVLSGGGGGYGAPFARDPDLVAADVRDGKVSADKARSQYGVSIGTGGMPDLPATRRLRAKVATDDGTGTIDRGPRGLVETVA